MELSPSGFSGHMIFHQLSSNSFGSIIKEIGDIIGMVDCIDLYDI